MRGVMFCHCELLVKCWGTGSENDDSGGPAVGALSLCGFEPPTLEVVGSWGPSGGPCCGLGNHQGSAVLLADRPRVWVRPAFRQAILRARPGHLTILFF